MDKKAVDLMLRYLSMLILAFSAPFFHYLLLPMTLYPVFWLLSLFFSANLQGSLLLVQGKEIEIISACLGSSAILLLMILNLATPSVKWARRAGIALFGLSLFFIFNWLRILILSYLYIKEYVVFNQLHLFSWYLISTLAVALIWILSINLFEVKEIPFLSDAKHLFKIAKDKK